MAAVLLTRIYPVSIMPVNNKHALFINIKKFHLFGFPQVDL